MNLFRIPPLGGEDERFLNLDTILTVRYESVQYLGRPKGRATVSFQIGTAEYFGPQAEFLVEKLRSMAATVKECEAEGRDA